CPGPPRSFKRSYGRLLATACSRPLDRSAHPDAGSELLGLRRDDLDTNKATLSVNRGLVAIGYDLQEPRDKTPNARQRIDLDSTTTAVLAAWQRASAWGERVWR